MYRWPFSEFVRCFLHGARSLWKTTKVPTVVNFWRFEENVRGKFYLNSDLLTYLLELNLTSFRCGLIKNIHSFLHAFFNDFLRVFFKISDLFWVLICLLRIEVGNRAIQYNMWKLAECNVASNGDLLPPTLSIKLLMDNVREWQEKYQFMANHFPQMANLYSTKISLFSRYGWIWRVSFTTSSLKQRDYHKQENFEQRVKPNRKNQENMPISSKPMRKVARIFVFHR